MTKTSPHFGTNVLGRAIANNSTGFLVHMEMAGRKFGAEWANKK